MDRRASQESLGLAQSTTTCPYEEKVITDPTTARIVLTFLRDFVDQRMVYAQNPQGYFCPMTKCESSFTEPLLLIQHLFTCPELGKGEFECWKCCSWHRFPTSEKEWADWTGWKSTTVGFQRKRSLGSKMKETLAETLALRRRNSNRKISISSIGATASAGLGQSSMLSATSSMITSSTLTGTTATVAPDMDGAVSSTQQPMKYRSPGDMCEWNQLLGLDQVQMLSPHSIQELQTAFRVDQQAMPTFAHTSGTNNELDTASSTANTSGYACTFNEGCFVTSEHHHHQHDFNVKPEPGARISAIPAACSCNNFESSSATSVGMDDRSATMMWSTDVDSSDTSNISSTRPSTTFDQSSSLPSSTNPSQGSLFAAQNLSPFSQKAARLISAGVEGGSSASLSSDIGTLRSPHTATATLLLNERGSTTTAFSPMSPLKGDDRLTVASSFASTPASGDFDQNDNLMDERHNWYHDGQNPTDSVILAPVSTDGGLSHITGAVLTTGPSLTSTTTTMANPMHDTSTSLEDLVGHQAHHHHHSHHSRSNPDGILATSMDIDMDGMPNHTHQTPPRHVGQQVASFIQGPASLAHGLRPAQHHQQYQDTHTHQIGQQQVPIVVQETTSDLNNDTTLHGGLYPTSASLNTALTAHAANPRYGFMGSGLSQTDSRPVSHHHHQSSSRTSLQPPKTPTSTIDDDVDPEDLICDQCQWKPRGVRENLRGYLRKHKNVHKGLRLSCDIPGCKKSFSRLDNLKTHRREKHGIDDAAPISKAASTTSIDSAGAVVGRQMTAGGSSILPAKRAMTMDDYNNERLNSMIPVSGMSTTTIPTQPQHVLQAAATIAQAQAQAQAQARQAQFQAQAQVQAQAQAQARAQFVQAHNMQVHAQVQAHAQAQVQAAHVQDQQAQTQAQALAHAAQNQAEPARPDSKRQRESFDHGGYRGVYGEHASLWPLMQI